MILRESCNIFVLNRHLIFIRAATCSENNSRNPTDFRGYRINTNFKCRKSFYANQHKCCKVRKIIHRFLLLYKLIFHHCQKVTSTICSSDLLARHGIDSSTGKHLRV